MNANLQSLLRALLTAAGTGYAVKSGMSAECAASAADVGANVALGVCTAAASYLWSVVNNAKRG